MLWIVLVAAALLGGCALVWLAQDGLIFFPQPVVSTAHLPADAKPLEIVATDGTRLRGIDPRREHYAGAGGHVFRRQRGRGLGNARRPALAARLTIVAINYRGYGTSEGKPERLRLSPTRSSSTTRSPRGPMSTPGGSSRSAAASAPASR